MITEFLGWLIILFPVLFAIWILFDLIKSKKIHKTDCDLSTGKRKESNNALFQAIEDGNLSKAKKAIAEGASVNVRGLAGKTPLIRVIHRASNEKYYHDEVNLNLVKLFIEKSADVNIRDQFNKNAIEYCDSALPGFVNKIIELLQKNGAEGYPRDSQHDISGL